MTPPSMRLPNLADTIGSPCDASSTHVEAVTISTESSCSSGFLSPLALQTNGVCQSARPDGFTALPDLAPPPTPSGHPARLPPLLSDSQRATLIRLCQLIPVGKWQGLVEGCQDPELVYSKLHALAANRQIKGVRLEVKKKEWIAAWTDAAGRERRRYFSIRQNGEEQALYMAVKARADAVRDGARIRWAVNGRKVFKSVTLKLKG